MKAKRLAIPDVILLEPTLHADERGFFFESFNQKTFESLTGLKAIFVQDNHSLSKKGTLRGLHFQIAPHEQDKLVRVIRGSIFDVAVDVRRGSPTFGQWVGELIDAASYRQIYIPHGFAHGFLALDEETEVLYKTTKYYEHRAERTLRWDDGDVGVAWPIRDALLLSEKDAMGTALFELRSLIPTTDGLS